MEIDGESAHWLAENERLRVENAALRQQLAAALALVEQLQQRVAELEARLNQDSHNSHWPSSRDKGRRGRPRQQSLRERSGKQAGGQPGHAGQTLKLVAEADEVMVYHPSHCQRCGHSLEGVAAASSERRQVFDLPPLGMVV